MYEQIARNKRRTWLLIVGALVLLGALGFFLGWLFATGVAGLIIALVIAIALSVGSYRYGDRVVLASARAREVTPQEEPGLHQRPGGPGGHRPGGPFLRPAGARTPGRPASVDESTRGPSPVADGRAPGRLPPAAG